MKGACKVSWPMMMPATLWAMVAMGGVGGARRSCAGQMAVLLLVVSWLLDWYCGTECWGEVCWWQEKGYCLFQWQWAFSSVAELKGRGWERDR